MGTAISGVCDRCGRTSSVKTSDALPTLSDGAPFICYRCRPVDWRNTALALLLSKRVLSKKKMKKKDFMEELEDEEAEDADRQSQDEKAFGGEDALPPIWYDQDEVFTRPLEDDSAAGFQKAQAKLRALLKDEEDGDLEIAPTARRKMRERNARKRKKSGKPYEPDAPGKRKLIL